MALAATLAYGDTLRHPFVFDDHDAILGSPNVRHLWPPRVAWGAPPGSGASGRPLVAATLALNYAVGGLDPRGYRLFNILAHVATAFVLFLLLRGTLQSRRMAMSWRSAAPSLAGAIAMLWLLHPLQTAAIDHVVYRNEILSGFFLLLVLEAVRRCSQRGWRWGAVAVIACLAGVAAKETMVSAPLLALAYDRFFGAGSWRAALRQRRGLYAGLAVSWLLLIALVTQGERGASVGFGFEDMTPSDYARTSIGVVVHYLRLVIWPYPLVLDYAWPATRSLASVAPQALLLAGLAVATIAGALRGHPLAFAGLTFFAWLAPTSSFIPLTGAVAALHRMYVPSMAVIACIVLGVDAARRWARWPAPRVLAFAGLLLPAVALGVVTRQRNAAFGSETRLWSETVDQRPHNPRAQNNLGSALVQAGRVEESLEHFTAAIRAAPDYAPAHRNLGSALVRLGRSRDALAPIREALRLDPGDGMTHYKLGQALQLVGDRAAAIASYEEALRRRPDLVMAHQNLGIAHLQGGAFATARVQFEAALALDPDHVGSLNNLAWLLATCPDDAVRDGTAAVRHAERAVRLTSGEDPEALDTLAAAYAEAGRFDAAVETLEQLRQRFAGDASAPHDKLAARAALYAAGKPYRMGS